MQNNPVENTKKTLKATVNSHPVSGNLPSNLAPIGFLLVGESSAVSSSFINFPVSTTIFLGAAINKKTRWHHRQQQNPQAPPWDAEDEVVDAIKGAIFA